MISRRAFAGAVSAAAFAQSTRRPNIVLIFADDLGYGDLGCYGHPTIRTPNLDRLASEGVRFTQFYSAAAVCSPSRAALMTGRHPVRTGLTRVLNPFSTGGIPDSEITMAQALKPLGYRTACVGKWHLGYQPKYLPTNHGFDSYFGIPYSNDMSPLANLSARAREMPPTPLIRNTETIEREPDQTQISRRYTEEATRFIGEASRTRNPFFLYMPHTFPHVPLHASDRFRGKSARGLYGDVVEELDWSVGEVLASIKKAGAENNTIVMFTSDNGPWLIKREEGGSAGLLRDGKGSTWEGGMREPFIARWPGRIPAGRVSAAFGTTMDLFPTLVKAAGGTVPADREYDGVDLMPQLAGTAPGREPLMPYYLNENFHALRKGPWKLHLRTGSQLTGKLSEPVETPELYHLEHDPSEKYNVADANPTVVKELSALAEKLVAGMTPGAPQR